MLLRKQNQELAEANCELQKRNEEMNEVMAIAAHDLRSPLVNVKGLFELLQTDPIWQREPYLRVITECGRTCGHTLDLIQNLLDAHRAECDRSAPSLQPLELDEVIAEVLEYFAPRAQSRGVVIRRASSGDDPVFVYSEPTVLKRAVMNVLSNAVRYSPLGATVLIAVTSTGETCRLTVSDEGPGVPEKDRGRLFGKFYKGSIPPTDHSPSAGLGLFIVKEILEKVGSSIAFEPRVPNGAHFHLTLPLYRREAVELVG